MSIQLFMKSFQFLDEVLYMGTEVSKVHVFISVIFKYFITVIVKN